MLQGVFHGMRVELARLLDRAFPPALPDGLQREYYRTNYRFARLPLILLGPFGALATLALLALNDDFRPRMWQVLTDPAVLTAIVFTLVARTRASFATSISASRRAIGSVCSGSTGRVNRLW